MQKEIFNVKNTTEFEKQIYEQLKKNGLDLNSLKDYKLSNGKKIIELLEEIKNIGLEKSISKFGNGNLNSDDIAIVQLFLKNQGIKTEINGLFGEEIYNSTMIYFGKNNEKVITSNRSQSLDYKEILEEKGINVFTESEIALDISLRIKEILENKGQKVGLTRKDDVFVSLEKRAETVKASKPDLFVSIHVNWFSSDTASGFEIHHGNNNKFAQSILESLGNETKQKNRGLKKTNLFVLNPNNIGNSESALIELGFITNLNDFAFLSNEKNRQKIAETIADTIYRYNPKGKVVIDPGHGGNSNTLYYGDGTIIEKDINCEKNKGFMICNGKRYSQKNGQYSDSKGSKVYIGDCHALRSRFTIEWLTVDSNGNGVNQIDEKSIIELQSKNGKKIDYKNLSNQEIIDNLYDIFYSTYSNLYPELRKREKLFNDFVKYQIGRIIYLKGIEKLKNGSFDIFNLGNSINGEIGSSLKNVDKNSILYQILLESEFVLKSTKGGKSFNGLFSGRTTDYELSGTFWKQMVFDATFHEKDGDSFGLFYMMLYQLHFESNNNFALSIKEIVKTQLKNK